MDWEIECYSCYTTFTYDELDEFTGCDTVDGQYIEYFAVLCPKCHCQNKV